MREVPGGGGDRDQDAEFVHAFLARRVVRAEDGVLAGFAVLAITQSSAKQRRFVADASHELRTPLADAAILVVQRESVDVAEVARSAAAVPARIPVELRADDEVFVLGDADQLTRLVSDLLDNADRHASAHVRLTVTT